MHPREHGSRILKGLAARPLLAAAMACVSGLLAGSLQPWMGWVVVVVFAVACWRFCARSLGLLVLLCSVVSLGVSQWRERQAEIAQRELLSLPVSEAEGRVVEDARGDAAYWRAPVELTGERSGAGHRVWWCGRGEVPVEGASVAGRGRFVALPSPRNPGEFDRAEWSKREGFVAQFRQGGDAVVVETPFWARVGADLRRVFRERLTMGLDSKSRAAMVIRAVVMGERPEDADELIEVFRLSGCLHVFSVSGLHVAMVAAIGWFLFSRMGLPRRYAVACLLPLVFGYAWLTGANPPAVRAAWMTAVFLGAFIFRRRPDLLNALGVVLLVGVLWDGRMLFRPGVQLSYGVVAAIGLGVPLISKWTGRMAEVDPLLPQGEMSRWQRWWLKVRQWLAASLGVSLAAGVGSAPLTAWHFGLLTPISVVAGLVMVPLVFLVLLVGLLSVAVSPVVPMASGGLNRCNGVLADGCAAVAGGFAAIPGGHFRIGVVRDPRLVVFDLDRGDAAACFVDGEGGGVLIDCGGSRSFEYTVLPSLQRLGVSPDAVVLSHPDAGHLGGGALVWQSLPIKQVLLPVPQARSEIYQAWVQDAAAAGVRVVQAADGMRLPLPDGAVLELLHVPDPEALNARADHRVMVMRMDWRGWRVLWTSDAGMVVEDALIDAGVDMTADVVVAGKHRTDLALSDRFVETVNPQLVVVANDDFPAGEQIDPGVMEYWRGRGVGWVDQSKSGAVEIWLDRDGALHIRGFVDQQEWVLRPD